MLEDATGVEVFFKVFPKKADAGPFRVRAGDPLQSEKFWTEPTEGVATEEAIAAAAAAEEEEEEEREKLLMRWSEGGDGLWCVGLLFLFLSFCGKQKLQNCWTRYKICTLLPQVHTYHHSHFGEKAGLGSALWES